MQRWTGADKSESRDTQQLQQARKEVALRVYQAREEVALQVYQAREEVAKLRSDLVTEVLFDM